ncbi:MAG: hypothetical protein GY787_06510 [Alteromonadales bacterium]|nr:hypothetical protein [Alteromonadales bacterium]
MAKQNSSPLKQNFFRNVDENIYGSGIFDESNVTAPVEYKPFVGDFSTDAVLDDARERRRTSTGLKGLELKLSKTKPGSPEYIRLKGKLDKKNFSREKKSIKKSIRKYGDQADFSDISTEFMKNQDLGGTVGDSARRTKKQLDRFLDRNQSVRSLFTDKVDRRDVYNEGIKARDKKIADAAKAEAEKQDEIDKRLNNKNIFSGNNIVFDPLTTSSISDWRWNSEGIIRDDNGNFKKFPKWSISGMNTNPSKLPGQWSIWDKLTMNFNGPKAGGGDGINNETPIEKRGEALYKKRPFISHTESITAGKPIGSLMKKFR